MKHLLLLLAAAALLNEGSFAAESPSRPKLQFINGGAQMVDIFWLKSAVAESNKLQSTPTPSK